MDVYRWSLFLHVAAGATALATFWTAAVLRKGSTRHRRVGQVFLVAMIGVLASGVPLTLGLIERGRPASALFLTFLLLLNADGCWNAWRAIRLRQHRDAYFDGLFWCITAIVALAGTGIIALGVVIGAPLFMVFGSLGPFLLVDALYRRRRAASDPLWWMREHYGAMIGNGVATHVAFLSIGLRNAVPGLDPAVVQQFAWFGPLLVAFVAAFWLDRRYGRRPAAVDSARGVRALS